ncbi:uncharacterized protein PAC_08804 [Phialocephala subalpina]|uniref:Uncharacterized protein n=1 Tax=Phialocephala subalpina TaxID=576137 RepID=A0A1L7X1N2_9HELO|nr:uncharacterized protein PAC_08804 [Phialocephala subalpina]
MAVAQAQSCLRCPTIVHLSSSKELRRGYQQGLFDFRFQERHFSTWQNDLQYAERNNQVLQMVEICETSRLNLLLQMQQGRLTNHQEPREREPTFRMRKIRLVETALEARSLRNASLRSAVRHVEQISETQVLPNAIPLLAAGDTSEDRGPPNTTPGSAIGGTSEA